MSPAQSPDFHEQVRKQEERILSGSQNGEQQERAREYIRKVHVLVERIQNLRKKIDTSTSMDLVQRSRLEAVCTHLEQSLLQKLASVHPEATSSAVIDFNAEIDQFLQTAGTAERIGAPQRPSTMNAVSEANRSGRLGLSMRVEPGQVISLNGNPLPQGIYKFELVGQTPALISARTGEGYAVDVQDVAVLDTTSQDFELDSASTQERLAQTDQALQSVGHATAHALSPQEAQAFFDSMIDRFSRNPTARQAWAMVQYEAASSMPRTTVHAHESGNFYVYMQYEGSVLQGLRRQNPELARQLETWARQIMADAFLDARQTMQPVAERMGEKLPTGFQITATIDPANNMSSGDKLGIKVNPRQMDQLLLTLQDGSPEEIAQFAESIKAEFVHEITHNVRDDGFTMGGQRPQTEIASHALQFLSVDHAHPVIDGMMQGGIDAVVQGSTETYDVARCASMRVLFGRLKQLARNKICTAPASTSPEDIRASIASIPEDKRQAVVTGLMKDIAATSNEDLLKQSHAEAPTGKFPEPPPPPRRSRRQIGSASANVGDIAATSQSLDVNAFNGDTESEIQTDTDTGIDIRGKR